MSKIIFNSFQIKQLEKNSNVSKVSERSISYKPEFKVNAVLENLKGKGPLQIFIEHGFDVEIIGKDKPGQCLDRWRKTYKSYGEEGFYTEKRGKGSTGRPSSKDKTAEQKLKKAEARIALLEAEVGVFKKARRTRKAGGSEKETLTKAEKFELIEQTLRNHEFPQMVSYFCKLAGVSRSGYYAFLMAETKRYEREKRDELDYKLIKYIFDKSSQKKGIRQIKLYLAAELGVTMNHKRVYRIMKKYSMCTKIRRTNPYKKMAKATQEHKTLKNILNRNFKQDTPQKALLTDITYLYYGKGQKAYLSCVKDCATREILASHVSTSLSMELTYSTLNKLEETLDGCVYPGAILHSDQGVHYTHPEFQKRVKEMGFIQSMSRKGNCWDNAPMESFFGHLKDEVDYRACHTINELKKCIYDYIEEYNHHRPQWTLNKMTPVEYRSQLLCA
ncbi:IS3 family transposase [Gottfriedia acidiceleris]|uniref:IS3 family transposase n=1 Tax=Gottfriedia acidiceleris TaxID=371036 RepID=UPI002F26AEB9